MTWWVEVRPSVQRTGRPRLVPLSEVGNYRGFRSTFAYSDHVADLIREQGSTSGLAGVEVYADTIFVDFDGRNSDGFHDWLVAEGYAFERADSGNRSDHYHIRCEPVVGAWVPAAMKSWVKRHAPTADMSIYHPAAQFRLMGTYHSKQPGRRKTLVYSQEGRSVALRQQDVAVIQHPRFEADEGDAYHRFFMNLTQTVTRDRRPYAFRTALLAAEAGLAFEEAVDHLLWWNSNFCSPCHDPATIRKQVEGAYRYMLRRAGNE